MIKHSILDRLSEPSTYAGLSVLAALYGVNADEWRAWGEALAGLFAIIAVIARENRVPKPSKKKPLGRIYPRGSDE